MFSPGEAEPVEVVRSRFRRGVPLSQRLRERLATTIAEQEKQVEVEKRYREIPRDTEIQVIHSHLFIRDCV